LVYRRIVKDLSDNNQILEDTVTILYAEKHFSRQLCAEPHKLEITLCYCDHLQHFARGLTETAMPGGGVRANRSTEAQRDFGIRQWLADTCCGHDLVQSSLALSQGGKAFIRLRAPKYLNTANGLTSIHQEMAMCIPQLDEMAEMLCCKNTPSVISIGKCCLEMGYAFYWPPYSENPFFVKPDGAHVVMIVENNIPYITGGNGDAACPGAEGDGNNADEENVQANAHPVVRNDVVDENATPRGDDPSQDDEGAGPNEIESLPHGAGAIDDDNVVKRVAPHDAGDVEAVYSRDFHETALEALTMRHLATRKPKLNSCETCRRAMALRAKHIRAVRNAENMIHKSRGPIPQKFGDQVTMDHIIVRSELNRGFKGQTNAITIMDRATGFRWGKGLRAKTGEANLEVIQRFQGRCAEDKIKHAYSDAVPEILWATKPMGIRGNHDTSILGDSQSNGIAENNNRDIKMGAAALLTHEGMPLAYWPLALPCYCFGHNAAIVDGVSPCSKRFGDNFDQSKMFAFGSAIRFVPSKVAGDKTQQFEASSQPGVCVGYAINSGCVWSGAYFVAHVREFATMNYHTGRRKSDQVIKIQQARDVFRKDKPTDAPFEFPLKPYHDEAFDAPEGWITTPV
jgi:hypothetical protein